MALLLVNGTGTQPIGYRLRKTITSIGRSEENDIILKDDALAETHAQIVFDGRDFTITALDRKGDLTLNGKKKKSNRLEHNDRIRIGRSDLRFCLIEPNEPYALWGSTGVAPDKLSSAEHIAYQKLRALSERMFEQYEPSALLESLLDAVIEITAAEKGFLILLEQDQKQVKVARNMAQKNLLDPAEQLSDSIVDKVLQTRKPILVSDALNNSEFQNARSVISLQLTSALCVPLLERGNLLGCLYVGSSSIRHPFGREHAEAAMLFAVQASLLLRNAELLLDLKLDNRRLTETIESMRFGSILGSCAAMQQVFHKVQKVATTDISVLITGETGTGKELIAREIHERSPRHDHPFVAINCGAIPDTLLESELFGYAKGAFTGATSNKTGKLQSANGGTLFLDEIGDMPLSLQVKLLRVLQEKVVIRVGDTRPEPIDIRVLAATHHDLDTEIKSGQFREDLFYRLNVVNLHLPPLRERGRDVWVIANYLLQRHAEQFSRPVRGFSKRALAAMANFSWPGNVRQLENYIKKACVLAEGELIEPEDLGFSGEGVAAIRPLAEAKEDFQRDYIRHVLEINQGNRTKTAKDLGIDPRTIFRHLEKESQSEAEDITSDDATPDPHA